jgi:lipopolysaccharide export system permease protein
MRNFLPPTLSAYLARVYAVAFLGLLGILLAIVYLFETVELLRRAAKFEGVGLSDVLLMGLLKLPETGQTVLPFAILFSALYSFWALARRHELVILRSAGLSVWQFLGPVIGVAMLAGFIHMTIINPLGAMMISRYETLETEKLNVEQKTVALSEQGLWLRQSISEGTAVLHAARVQMPEWKLSEIMVLYFGTDGSFNRRMDADSAVLKGSEWQFRNVTINRNGHMPAMTPYDTLPTDLTVSEIEESFSSPEETPFWSLPSYIRTMEATGFDARKLKIHYHGLLAQPLLFAAMVILAATVSLRVARFQNTAMLVGAGVVFGFVMFFATSFLKALGASDQIPVLLAAWFPPLIALSLGISVIMTTEDG